MWEYLIKSMLCLMMLLAFYKVFLENEKAHIFKRFFLLGSLILSVLLPLITITYTTQIEDKSPVMASNMGYSISEASEKVTLWETFSEYIPYLLGGIYSLGIIFFSIRFCKNIYGMQKRVSQGEKHDFSSYIIVLLKSKLIPHTFLSYIFLNKDEYKNEQISKEVFLHEKAHVDQKHSLDIIFMEIVQIIFWINPAFIWLKRSARLNHEFLADEQVISETRDASNYSEVLFKYAGSTHHVSLSSSINYALTKKRIIMISKSYSIKKLLAKIGLLIPVLGCCIFFFNNDIVAKPVLASDETAVNYNSKLYNSQDQKTEEIKPDINLMQEPKIKVKIEGNNVWLNGKKTTVNDFSEAVNEITKNWSEADLKNVNIHMSTENTEEGFLQKLDTQFSKTRLAKVSGHGMLPPPPPMPPTVGQVPPPAPPVPPASWAEVDIHGERAKEWIHMKDAERKMIVEERRKIQEIKKELEDDARFTPIERTKMREKVREKQVEINQKMREVERKRRKIEREHIDMDRAGKHRDIPVPPNPPAPPNPADAIDDIERQGGSFYYNGKEIDAEKAKQLVQKNDNIQIHVKKGSGENKARFEISDH
ncbi:M56 family metallopeptidase [Christiangramia sp.]|uniref:M56 family metallopeptidase n=1 Tax=Christiangramia sp. TaxID=1931228 RepID=UPI002635603A|nr:M56 family metallopeptidase [Christiangramia sp.]